MWHGITHSALQWRHNECDGVSNHQPRDFYSTVYSDTDQRKHQSSASLAFVWGIHRGPVNSPHKWPVTRKMIPFDDVIMDWGKARIRDSLITTLDMLPLSVSYGMSIVRIWENIKTLSVLSRHRAVYGSKHVWKHYHIPAGNRNRDRSGAVV